MPPKALIFDFGNVFAHFDYLRACERLAAPLGFSGRAFLKTARERGLTPILQQYERGDLTSREFSGAVLKMMGLDLSHEAFATAWADIFQLNEPVAALVEELKAAGHTLILGSNTNEMHATHFRRQFAEPLAYFDHLVLSYQVREIKPAAEFYHACARAAGRSPGECVFIDDMPENVEGARSAGLDGVHYRDTPSLIADLRALGVRLGPAA
jgi:glucose-1-phosphatase